MVQSDTMHFIKAVIRNPAKVGAIAPSSAILARAMVADLHITAQQTVIEFGPGTGPFTLQLQEVLPRCEQGHIGYLGIERDEAFVALLRKRFPQMQFVTGSAENAHRFHAESGLGPVRAVISGLPFASLPAVVQNGIVDSLDQLMQQGSLFRTFQYAHAYGLPSAVRFRRRMVDIFGPFERSRLVMRNLPPAFVLTWRR